MQKKEIERLIFSGGFYHKSTQTFESAEALKTPGSIRAGNAFVTLAGASREPGLTCANQYEVRLRQLGLSNAQKKILLMDSSRFGKVTPVFFGTWSQIDALVTDAGIPPQWRDFLAENGIELIIANGR